LVNNGEEFFEAESSNVLAHFVQIFQIFEAAFIEFSTLAFELVNQFFVAVEVGASVGVSFQIHDGFQLVEFVSEIFHLVDFLVQSFLVFSCGALGEFVNQILNLDVSGINA